MSQARYAAGLHVVARIVKRSPKRIRRLLIDERSKNTRLADLIALARDTGVSIQGVRRYRLDDMASGTAHQGVIADLEGSDVIDEAALRSLVEACLTNGEPLTLLLLDQIQDPHNLGACLRSASGAGVQAVVVPTRDAAGLTPAVRKIASGAAETLPLARVASLAQVLKWLGEYGVQRLATEDQAPDSLFEAPIGNDVAWVLGAEETGVSAACLKHCDQTVSIPMRGEVESLNVSVATGVVLYETLRRKGISELA